MLGAIEILQFGVSDLVLRSCSLVALTVYLLVSGLCVRVSMRVQGAGFGALLSKAEPDGSLLRLYRV